MLMKFKEKSAFKSIKRNKMDFLFVCKMFEYEFIDEMKSLKIQSFELVPDLAFEISRIILIVKWVNGVSWSLITSRVDSFSNSLN